MKATIHDPEALRALGALDVAAYLRTNGWKQVEQIGDKGAIWSFEGADGEDYEIALPYSPDLRDFVPRMAEALQALELAEHRSQLEILRDLINSPADVIRIRSAHPEADDGTIPLAEGVQLVERARDMVLAAACAAIKPKPYFPARKPTAASEYLDKIRLGQTERGSYVITLLSRVPPSLEPTKNGQARLDVEEPFERRVTLTLARGLTAVRNAAQEAAISGEIQAFEKAVADGVSADLCEAIAALAGTSAEPRAVEVNLTWSPRRPLESDAPGRVLLPADAIPIIKEAGRVFRETSPREDYELRGIVIGLHRNEPAQSGRVTVLGFVDETARHVTLELSGKDYDLAIKAHRDHKLIRCRGELVKTGRLFELVEPKDFELVEAE